MKLPNILMALGVILVIVSFSMFLSDPKNESMVSFFFLTLLFEQIAITTKCVEIREVYDMCCSWSWRTYIWKFFIYWGITFCAGFLLALFPVGLSPDKVSNAESYLLMALTLACFLGPSIGFYWYTRKKLR